MSRRLVLIDSSAWISHLTGSHRGVSDTLEELIRTERAATNAIVRLELLTGARDPAQYADLSDAFQSLPHLPLSDAVWHHAEHLRFSLRRAGTLIPLPDAVIASCALIHRCEVLHVDRHFAMIARFVPLACVKLA